MLTIIFTLCIVAYIQLDEIKCLPTDRVFDDKSNGDNLKLPDIFRRDLVGHIVDHSVARQDNENEGKSIQRITTRCSDEFHFQPALDKQTLFACTESSCVNGGDIPSKQCLKDIAAPQERDSTLHAKYSYNLVDSKIGERKNSSSVRSRRNSRSTALSWSDRGELALENAVRREERRNAVDNSMRRLLLSIILNDRNAASNLMRPSLLFQEMSDGHIRPLSVYDVTSMVNDYVASVDDTSYLASKRNMFDPLGGGAMPVGNLITVYLSRHLKGNLENVQLVHLERRQMQIFILS